MSKQIILTIPDSVDLSALREMKLILRYYKDGNDLYEYSTDSFSLSEAKGDHNSCEALKEAIKEAQAEGFVEVANAFDCVYDIIDNAPPASDYSVEIARKSIELGRSIGKLESKIENKRQQGKWIPVSEKLPDFWEAVLVTDECGKVFEYERRPLDDDENECREWSFLGRKIIAWMPEPEPYQKGDMK